MSVTASPKPVIQMSTMTILRTISAPMLESQASPSLIW